MRKQITHVITGLGFLAIVLLPVGARAQGHPRSGIMGDVVLYGCPAQQIGDDCEQPYPTTIRIVTSDRHLVTHVTTDAQGHFVVFLLPGNYILIPASAGQNTLPSVEPLAVRVQKKKFTPVTIVYDSGIR